MDITELENTELENTETPMPPLRDLFVQAPDEQEHDLDLDLADLDLALEETPEPDASEDVTNEALEPQETDPHALDEEEPELDAAAGAQPSPTPGFIAGSLISGMLGASSILAKGAVTATSAPIKLTVDGIRSFRENLPKAQMHRRRAQLTEAQIRTHELIDRLDGLYRSESFDAEAIAQTSYQLKIRMDSVERLAEQYKKSALTSLKKSPDNQQLVAQVTKDLHDDMLRWQTETREKIERTAVPEKEKKEFQKRLEAIAEKVKAAIKAVFARLTGRHRQSMGPATGVG